MDESLDAATSPLDWRREVAIAALAVGFGSLVLPFGIYLVGERLLAAYSTDTGAFALAERIWLDLLALRLPAWILVLSPYLILQLVRGVRRLWRRKSL